MPTDSDERRRALVKLTIKTLQKLLGGGDSGNSGNSGIGGGKAMSLETVQAPGGGDLSYFLRHFS
jgi:hypothetical protein